MGRSRRFFAKGLRFFKESRFIGKGLHLFKEAFSFTLYLWQRYQSDGVKQHAASLTFTSLLAAVPLLAVSFAIFSAFPAFAQLKQKVLGALFKNLMPQMGNTVQGYLTGFTQQASSLTAIGIVFLIITAVMLLLTVSGAFNRIWNVKENRVVVSRLMVFWAVLTLGPILLGASLSVSSYIFSVINQFGGSVATGMLFGLARFVPLLLGVVGLLAIYMAVPNTYVAWKDALWGGFVASGLIEGLKIGFAFYIIHFPTYQNIYGALATIPIFLVWLYLCWTIVLLGAEIAAALPEWRAGIRTLRQRQLSPVGQLSATLALLAVFYRAQKIGVRLEEGILARTAKAPAFLLYKILPILESKGIITKAADNKSWVLSYDMRALSLYDLYHLFVVDIKKGQKPEALLEALSKDDEWRYELSRVLKDMDDAHKEIMKESVGDILSYQKAVPLNLVDKKA